MTAMLLFKKRGVYKAGGASAPTTHLTHSMSGPVTVAGRPNTHPEVYRKVSANKYAEALEDHLMILRGMQDTIVLFKNSVTLHSRTRFRACGLGYDYL